MTVQAMTRPTSSPTAVGDTVPSTLKSILVHIQNDGSEFDRVEAALSIARSQSAHLTCLHVTPIEAYVAFDTFGGVFVVNDVIKKIEDEVAQLRVRIEGELRKEDVSWDYVEVTGNIPTQIVRHSALADLVITGRGSRETEYSMSSMALLGDLLQNMRTPLLVPGTGAVDPSGPAVIAWDGSFEAASAVRLSVGLLKLASSVRVLNLADSKEQSSAFPGTSLLEYLSRHGIHAELVVEQLPAGADDELVAAGLVARARAWGAAFIVMGGYGHSRVREFLFGGVTRSMLRDSSVPIVIAH